MKMYFLIKKWDFSVAMLESKLGFACLVAGKMKRYIPQMVVKFLLLYHG